MPWQLDDIYVNGVMETTESPLIHVWWSMKGMSMDHGKPMTTCHSFMAVNEMYVNGSWQTNDDMSFLHGSQ